MIIDSLENCEKYSKLHPLFKKAFAFLKKATKKTPTKYIIEGTKLFAIVMNIKNRGKKNSPLEVHKKYIDIQFLISGKETHGWKTAKTCKKVSVKYNTIKDIMFFKDEPDFYFGLLPNQFVIYFPNDAHAPLAGNGPVKKIVIKVKA